MEQQADNVRLSPSWKPYLVSEFQQSYMHDLKGFLRGELSQAKQIFPRGSEYFAALDLTPLESVKVVILGQDPYHGPGQAHGLCFSVRPGVGLPPSLVNIYKELQTDLGIKPVSHGYLESWARQGVLLLNSVLTVERGMPSSHANRGWERFTDRVIEVLNREREHVVFLLWGAYAQKKGRMIDRQRHCVLETHHPSPLSAHRGFFGCRHFSRANAYLQAHGITPIDWQLPANPQMKATDA